MSCVSKIHSKHDAKANNLEINLYIDELIIRIP